MRKLVLIAICCSGLFYAPLPLVAQRGGDQAPLIPVADMPHNSGGATAPSEPPLEVDAEEVPELLPPQEVTGGGDAGGGAVAPARAPTATPAPATAPPPEPAAPSEAEPAQTPDQPTDGEEPVGEVPDDAPTAPDVPEADEPDEEEFEEEFDDVPEAGEPDAPAVTPGATAGPQLPRTGADLPALLLSGLALLTSGMSLRALCAGRT